MLFRVKNFGSVGSFQICQAVIGLGLTPGCVVQYVPPGLYRFTTRVRKCRQACTFLELPTGGWLGFLATQCGVP